MVKSHGRADGVAFARAIATAAPRRAIADCTGTHRRTQRSKLQRTEDDANLIYSRIAGTGSHLPEKVLTNFDLEKMVDTSDEWIRTRTGIERRHIAATARPPSISPSTPRGARSRRRASGRRTSTSSPSAPRRPDLVFPNCGALLQERLGCRGAPAFSVETACTGFMYALRSPTSTCAAGTRSARWSSAPKRSRESPIGATARPAILFADGAGAVVLEPTDEPGILSTHLHADGQYKDLLYCASGVSNGFRTSEPRCRSP